MVTLDNTTTPRPMGRAARRRMRRRMDSIVTAYRHHGNWGLGMSFGKIAELFDLPKTTVRLMVERGEKDDAEEVRRAAYDFGLLKMDLSGLPHHPPPRPRAAALKGLLRGLLE